MGRYSSWGESRGDGPVPGGRECQDESALVGTGGAGSERLKCLRLCQHARRLDSMALAGGSEVNACGPNFLKGNLETTGKLDILDDKRGQSTVTSQWVNHCQHDDTLVNNAQLHWQFLDETRLLSRIYEALDPITRHWVVEQRGFVDAAQHPCAG